MTTELILLATVVLSAVVVTLYLRRRRRTPEGKTEYMELGTDPLDPRGDGTIRPGDPLFDLIVNSPEGPAAIYASRESDTSPVWKVTQVPITDAAERAALEAALEEMKNEEGDIVFERIDHDEED